MALATEAGDLKVHTTCTIHESLPPRTVGRKVLYTGFGLPARPYGGEDALADTWELRNQAHVLTSQPSNDRRGGHAPRS